MNDFNVEQDMMDFKRERFSSRWILRGNCPKLRSITSQIRTPEPPCSKAPAFYERSTDLLKQQAFVSPGFEKKYRCSTCAKTFSNPTNLRMHEFAHKDEIPSRCRCCFKRFPRSSLLKIHEIAHNVNVERLQGR
mmetsp:Transcript_20849/g.40296  ORF Transcript_20849/g.40296 Transcript_20849/m.40296 type:complete len:134 (-) Transcript_20849:282-683(-)